MNNFNSSNEGITWCWKEGVNGQGMRIRFQAKLKPSTYIPVRQAQFADDGICMRGAFWPHSPVNTGVFSLCS